MRDYLICSLGVLYQTDNASFQILIFEQIKGNSDVGDFMMVSDLRCWWHNHYVGDFFRYFGIGQQALKPVTDKKVSNIRHRHQC